MLKVTANYIETCQWHSSVSSNRLLELDVSKIGDLDSQAPIRGHIRHLTRCQLSGVTVRLRIDYVNPIDAQPDEGVKVLNSSTVWLDVGDITGSLYLSGIAIADVRCGKVGVGLTLANSMGLVELHTAGVEGPTAISCSASAGVYVKSTGRFNDISVLSPSGLAKLDLDVPAADEISVSAIGTDMTIRNCSARKLTIGNAINNNGIVRIKDCRFTSTIDGEVPVMINSSTVRTVLENVVIVSTSSGTTYSIDTTYSGTVNVRFYGFVVSNKMYNGAPFVSGGPITPLSTGFVHNSQII